MCAYSRFPGPPIIKIIDMMSRHFCSFSNRIRHSFLRQQIPAMRPNDAMPQKHQSHGPSRTELSDISCQSQCSFKTVVS